MLTFSEANAMTEYRAFEELDSALLEVAAGAAAICLQINAKLGR